MRSASVVASTALLLLVAGCSRSESEPERTTNQVAYPRHVHGLAVDPSTGDLQVATHAGLFRVPAQGLATRVSAAAQDFMGFAVATPDRLLASGHPDLSQTLPPHLGLLESRDGGRSWSPVSLLGKADFHVLEPIGSRIYGYDGLAGRIRVSDDGTTWRDGAAGSVTDLLADPSDPAALLVATPQGLGRSQDAGMSVQPVEGPAVVLLARADGVVAGIDAQGNVYQQDQAGWSLVSRLPGTPTAFAGAPGAGLYVALQGGALLASADQGRSWAPFGSIT